MNTIMKFNMNTILTFVDKVEAPPVTGLKHFESNQYFFYRAIIVGQTLPVQFVIHENILDLKKS